MPYQPITPLEEHKFWLEILKDHSYFIRDYLSPAEKNWVNQANQFINWFDQVEEELHAIPADTPLNSPTMMAFARKAYDVAYSYYLFEGHLQNLRLKNEVNLNLTPTYLNGTLSENNEYLRILNYYMAGSDYPPLSLYNLLSLWLEDQLGHAALLIRLLDGIEFDLIERANRLRLQFSQAIVKNNAIKGYLRFTHENFPVQIKFAHDVTLSVIQFNQLVGEVVSFYKNDELVNQATLRFLEHHFPESCYFLRKLSYYAPNLEFPPCSLSKGSLYL